MNKFEEFFVRTKLAIIVLLLSGIRLFAQNKGLDSVGTALREVEGSLKSNVVEPAIKVALVVCAIMGVAGGVRSYIKFQDGDQDAAKSAKSVAIGGGVFFGLLLMVRLMFLGGK